jgi:hypothetical protein
VNSEDWRVGYQRAVVGYVIRQGRAANVTFRKYWPSHEGVWETDTYMPFKLSDDQNLIDRHVEACGIDFSVSGEVKGVEWSNFENTYTENSQYQGVQARCVCTCGKVNEIFRVEGTFSDILEGIFREGQ